MRSRIVCNGWDECDRRELELPRVQGWPQLAGLGVGKFKREIANCARREELAAWQELGLGRAHALVGPGGRGRGEIEQQRRRTRSEWWWGATRVGSRTQRASNTASDCAEEGSGGKAGWLAAR